MPVFVTDAVVAFDLDLERVVVAAEPTTVAWLVGHLDRRQGMPPEEGA